MLYAFQVGLNNNNNPLHRLMRICFTLDYNINIEFNITLISLSLRSGKTEILIIAAQSQNITFKTVFRFVTCTVQLHLVKIAYHFICDLLTRFCLHMSNVNNKSCYPTC